MSECTLPKRRISEVLELRVIAAQKKGESADHVASVFVNYAWESD